MVLLQKKLVLANLTEAFQNQVAKLANIQKIFIK